MATPDHKPEHKYDVIVVGAGAAGLSAAALLGKSNLSVCILEARARIGGRIFTQDEPGCCAPIELGAEFIHGRARATFSWLRRINLAAVDAGENRWTAQSGKLQPAENLFDEMKRGFDRIRRPKNDLPFSKFLDNNARNKLSPAVRKFARTLVEGFDAADATRVSTLQTLDEWSGSSAADAPTFRPNGGYAALIRGISNTLEPDKVELQLNTVVQEVSWTRGKVTIDATRLGQPYRVSARQAIITLPLGVLQIPAQAPNAIRFTPALIEKQTALDQLGVGPVIKVTLRFRRSFWEELAGGRFYDAAFFHAPGASFPTFWSSLPTRAPLLIAWAAGPNANRLSGHGEAEIVEHALHSLESMFGKRTSLRSDLQGAYLHDWQADSFALGAYSYVTAGGLGARKILAKPLKNTLFIAGEAADVEGESGTVAGALQSGERAAQMIIKSRVRK